MSREQWDPRLSAEDDVREADERTAAERVEDAAFENRIRTLTAARKWHELRAVLIVYGSAFDEREQS